MQPHLDTSGAPGAGQGGKKTVIAGGRRPRILQTGTYSALNKGDATLQWATATMLQRRLPDAQITISCPFPSEDSAFYHPFHVLKTRRRNPLHGTWLLIRALAWNWMATRLGLRWDRLVEDAELRAFRDADLVVDISGDMLTEDYGVHIAYSHFLPILTGIAMDKPVMLLAQTIGPFSTSRPLARWILKRVARITVRDGISLEYVKEMNVCRDDLELTADVAFRLDPAPLERAREILAAEGIARSARPMLGVTVSRLIATKFWRKTHAAGNFVDFFAELLDAVVERLDVDLVFIPHVLGPGTRADDRELSTEIAARMRHHAQVLRGNYRPEEIKAIIGNCQLFLGARMHANIAALTSLVPTVAISYSHKTPGVLESLGVAEFVCSLEDLGVERITHLLKNALARREEIAMRVHERLPELNRRALRNFDIAVELLASCDQGAARNARHSLPRRPA